MSSSSSHNNHNINFTSHFNLQSSLIFNLHLHLQPTLLIHLHLYSSNTNFKSTQWQPQPSPSPTPAAAATMPPSTMLSLMLDEEATTRHPAPMTTRRRTDGEDTIKSSLSIPLHTRFSYFRHSSFGKISAEDNGGGFSLSASGISYTHYGLTTEFPIFSFWGGCFNRLRQHFQRSKRWEQQHSSISIDRRFKRVDA
jgi:hypothetical protein